MPKMTMGELEKELSGFIGTEGYHKCTMVPNYVCTDGVIHMAEKMGAFWLLDAIASYQRKEEMQFWKLTVKGTKAELIMQEDSDKPILIKQNFSFTDFPEGEFDIWVGLQPTEEGKDLYVMMLKSEY